jgi:hypothetical protein
MSTACNLVRFYVTLLVVLAARMKSRVYGSVRVADLSALFSEKFGLKYGHEMQASYSVHSCI